MHDDFWPLGDGGRLREVVVRPARAVDAALALRQGTPAAAARLAVTDAAPTRVETHALDVRRLVRTADGIPASTVVGTTAAWGGGVAHAASPGPGAHTSRLHRM